MRTRPTARPNMGNIRLPMRIARNHSAATAAGRRGCPISRVEPEKERETTAQPPPQAEACDYNKGATRQWGQGLVAIGGCRRRPEESRWGIMVHWTQESFWTSCLGCGGGGAWHVAAPNSAPMVSRRILRKSSTPSLSPARLCQRPPLQAGGSAPAAARLSVPIQHDREGFRA